MGRDKATLRLAGTPLWEIVASTLEPLVDSVILVNSGSAYFSTCSCRQLTDDPPGNGPLGGIVTGLEQSGYQHHLVMAVDYPLVQPALLRLLLARAAGVWAVCGRSATFLEPLLGYYNAACAPVIRRMLAEGELRTHMLYERVPSVILEMGEYEGADPRRLSQLNVNTPEDMERAAAIYQEIDATKAMRGTADR
jgi:molybdopterin-guanine dinucleotide biosynthesis protein A